MLAATPAPTENRDGGADKESDFPGEQPSDKELSDWLDAVLPSVRQSFGAVLNGDTPSHLIELTLGADDLTGYTRLTVGSTEAGTMTAGQVAAHERRDGNMRRRNAGGTTEGVDGYGGCGCKWTAQQRRWTSADPGFRNLSHIIVLGALEVLIW